jgi:hydrogenase maturation protein HypF
MHAPGVMAPAASVGNPVPADLAICADCRRELLDPHDRRHGHPFIACAHCGPRFSIIETLPGDREHTTLHGFRLCAECQRDFEHPTGRRFGVAALTCLRCGPHVILTDPAGELLAARDSAIYVAAKLLGDGRIVAVKGPGGYQLFADATSVPAIGALRARKHDPGQPFAVLFRDLAAVRTCAELTPAAARALQSPTEPAVLVPRRTERPLAAEIAPHGPWLAARLASSPLEILLVQAAGRPLAVTGTNDADEPPCATAEEAHARLLGIADAFLEHNLAIAHPAAESLVRVAAHGPIVLRRGRGGAPAALSLPAKIPGHLLCVGAERRNAVAVAAGDQVIIGPHTGDLRRLTSLRVFERMIETLRTWQGTAFTTVACERSATCAATQHARALGLPCVTVQHHLAHALSCLLEHRRSADDVLAVVWDRGGPGEDGTAWGGEFLRFQKGVARRFARLRTFRLPGREAAPDDPRNTLLGLLHAMGDAHFGPFAHEFGLAATEAAVLHADLARDERGPSTSSAGRLFDGAAVLLRVGEHNTFDGEAACAVEAAAAGARGAHLVLPMPWRKAPGVAGGELDWAPLLEAMITQRARGRDVASLAAAFHRALAHGIVDVARRAGVGTVALTGGCFQNALLTDLAASALQAAGFEVLLHHEVPPNNNGIAAGQALATLWNLTTVTRN